MVDENVMTSIIRCMCNHSSVYRLGSVALLFLLFVAIGFLYISYPKRAMEESVRAFAKNDLQTALVQINKVLKRNPSDIQALLFKATILSQRGSLEFKEFEYGQQSLDVLNRVLTLDPNNPEALRLMGYAYEIMELYDHAHASYTKALALDPGNADILFGDAHAWDLQGNLERAEAGYRAALMRKPDLAEAHAGLARIYAQRGLVQESIAEFELVASSADSMRLRAEANYSVGSMKLSTGDIASAEARIRKSIEIDPSYPLGWVGLGSALAEKATHQGSEVTEDQKTLLIQDSLKSLERAMELNRDQSLAYYYAAMDYFYLHDLQKAKELMDKAKMTIEDDITLGLGDKERMRKRVDASLAIFTMLLNPRDELL